MQTQRASGSSSQRRFVTITLVAAIHIAAIYALLVALNPTFIPHLPPVREIDLFTPKQTPPTKPTTDIPVTFRTPGVPIPDVPNVDVQHNPASIYTPPASGGDGTQTYPTQPVITPLRAILATHTTPDYPPLAARLDEQGSVRLSLRIDERGYVADASVIGSSGYQTLDAAAIAWVRAHWRYAPAQRDGTPVPALTEAVVTFRLTNRRG